MAENTKIEWTDATWNPWHGCRKVSPGCKNCYMFRDKARYGQDPNIVVRSKDATFYAPLKWKEPRKIFTCSWSDFFIEEADEWRDEAFAIMALTPQHTYQVLTKRPERMLDWFVDADRPPVGTLKNTYWRQWCVWAAMSNSADNRLACESAYIWDWDENTNGIYGEWPLPNVWLGVSAEDQKNKPRIDLLRGTPAAVHFLSLEPLLEDLGELNLTGIDWVIVGGESGPNARPMHPAWIRSIRDQCISAGIPFFFKQWGEYARVADGIANMGANNLIAYKNGMDEHVYHFGKSKAGRLLDGREWNEMPEVQNAL